MIAPLHRPKVLLVYPDVRVPKPPLPLGPLHIAGACERAGLDPVIVDTRVEDLQKEDIDGAVVVGISAMTGTQIGEGLKAARAVRAHDPRIPIVWGGVHPTILPGQTLEHPLVDAIVRAEGEDAFVEIAHRVIDGKDLEGIAGVWFKRNGETVKNPMRPNMEMDGIPPLPYRLLHMDRYQDTSEYMPYQITRGCPERCTFCYHSGQERRKWRYKSVETVVRDLRLLKAEFNPKRIYFVDDQLLASKPFMLELAQALVRERLGMVWNSSTTLYSFVRYTDEEVRLLRQSGCYALFFGGESGSTKILESIHKRNSIGDCYTAVDRCKQAGIKAVFSFMVGFPDETPEDVARTMDLIDALARRTRLFKCKAIWRLCPFPGTDVFEDAVRYGYKPPETLDGWDGYGYMNLPQLPWLSKSRFDEYAIVNGVTSYEIVNQWRFRFPTKPRQVIYDLVTANARMRWRMRLFRFAPEWRLRNHIFQEWFGKGTT